MLEPLSKGFGKLSVAQSTIDLYQTFIDKQRISPPSSSMRKVGDKYALSEYSEEEIENYIQKYERIKEWAEENCDIIKTVEDIPRDLHQTQDLIRKEFIDVALTAKASGKTLISDDKNLRLLAKTSLQVDGVWSQALLLSAKNSGLISKEDYASSTIDMIDADFEFTTINAETLMIAAQKEGWELTNKLEKALNTLGGKRIEPRSSLDVSMEFLQQLWTTKEADNAKSDLTVGLIKSVIKERMNIAPELVRAMQLHARSWGTEEGHKLADFIEQWRIENSIEKPQTSQKKERPEPFYTSQKAFWLSVVVAT